MNYKDLDLTYYAKVFTKSTKYKNKIYIQYSFTFSKRLLDNNVDEPLPYYRLGNWKTKEIFKTGKIITYFKNNSVYHNKNIAKSMVKRLNLNKHDILRIRLEDDIIWIEKIDNIYNYKSTYITYLIRQNDTKSQLYIPTVICNGRTTIDLDFLGDILPNVNISEINCISLSNKLIEKNDLTIDIDLLCTIQNNNLTVKRLINE